jgi:hypothetical protein
MVRLIVIRFDIHLKGVSNNLSNHEFLTYVNDILPNTLFYILLGAKGIIHANALTRIIFKSFNEKGINGKTV